MSDQKRKLLEILAFKKQLNALPIFQNASTSRKYLHLLQKRRSTIIKKMFLLRKQYFLLLSSAQYLSKQSRLYWRKERSQTFWEVDCQVNGGVFFKSNFKMKISTFLELCGYLRVLEKEDTPLRKAITLHKRVAIALYALGSSAEYRTIGNTFGVGKSAVCGIVKEFCIQTWKVLSPTFMPTFPLTRQKIAELVQGFEIIGFPQCMGAIDGCHIEIHPPRQDATDYHNYKGWYSTILLALVDARCTGSC
ncbi:protein ALP1-like isoform X2 [Rhagoletis pomonella]|uniref:protein ALP1-like isoform X2 n=1 Tax=Rhagoletis pomonella TaxID=28610 RepID=UPI00177AF743|nr:protein ALP1-like isoform X2 [Rhagoletis pomonella]